MKRWGYQIAICCLDDEIDTKLAGHHFPIAFNVEPDVEIQSSHGGSSDWESDLSGSFQELCKASSSQTKSSKSRLNVTASTSRAAPSVSLTIQTAPTENLLDATQTIVTKDDDAVSGISKIPSSAASVLDLKSSHKPKPINPISKQFGIKRQ